MIRFDRVAKRYPPGIDALSNVSFEIATGQMAIIEGHSGAGKSTILKLMAAMERPTGGAVLIGGQNVGSLKRQAIPYLRRNLGLVFQDQKLLFDRSALDNVLLPLDIVGEPRRDAIRRAQAALDKVGLLERQNAMPVALSGGEQQRLAIARAVVNRPALILADEPTANLDAESAEITMKLFRAFHQVGTSILIATHDPAWASQLGARLIRLEAGRTS